jgi:hypothetical protein
MLLDLIHLQIDVIQIVFFPATASAPFVATLVDVPD